MAVQCLKTTSHSNLDLQHTQALKMGGKQDGGHKLFFQKLLT